MINLILAARHAPFTEHNLYVEQIARYVFLQEISIHKAFRCLSFI